MRQEKYEKRPQQTMAVLENRENRGNGRYDRETNRAEEYRQEDTQKQNERQPYVCVFCGGYHKSAECPDIYTKAGRIQQLRRKKRCTRCLKRHNEAKCSTTLQACKMCPSELHHYALCPRLIEKIRNEVQQTNFLAEKKEGEVYDVDDDSDFDGSTERRYDEPSSEDECVYTGVITEIEETSASRVGRENSL